MELPNKDYKTKRIEEWVMDLQYCSPLEEKNEFSISNDPELKDGNTVLEGPVAAKLDDKANPGMEAAKRYISSMNTTATTAELTNLRLVVLPFLNSGYMSPEYASDGLFSINSDVFSFGVVVLEIVTGKKNTGFYQSSEDLNLLGYVWRLWSENKALDLVDPILLESCEKPEVIKFINVGLLCVEEDPSDLPTMSNVDLMLSGETAVVPVPNQPAFVMRRRVFSTSSSSSNKSDSISNELTMSDL